MENDFLTPKKRCKDPQVCLCFSSQFRICMNGSQRSILKANTSMCIRCIVRSIADDLSTGPQKVCIILVSSYPHDNGAPYRFYLL